MKIIMENIEPIELVDNQSLLSAVQDDLKDSLSELSEQLYTDIMSNTLLRVFYDKKSLIDIKPIYKDDVLSEFVVTTYLSDNITCQPEELVDTIEDLILKLNFFDR